MYDMVANWGENKVSGLGPTFVGLPARVRSIGSSRDARRPNCEKPTSSGASMMSRLMQSASKDWQSSNGTLSCDCQS
jgi:hypothetical protein